MCVTNRWILRTVPTGRQRSSKRAEEFIPTFLGGQNESRDCYLEHSRQGSFENVGAGIVNGVRKCEVWLP